MNKRMNKQTEQTNKLIRRMNEWMNKQANGWTNE
jgi:hypothetical protein